MKEQVKDMFAEITMPEEIEEKIRVAMAQHRGKKNTGKTIWKSLATAAAVLALVLVISPQARAVVEGWVLKYIFPESGITVFEEKDANGNVTGIMAVDTEAPPFARVENGRIYYIRNGEEWDITEKIKEDAPFYDIYVDDYGLTHYRAVAYSGSLENYGIYEFFRMVEEGQGPREGWEGGTGRNFLDPETGTRYPWVDIIWEEWDVPWPMPD